jgi:hypothetical protein
MSSSSKVTFILGCQRSGTTLAEVMLGVHPGIRAIKTDTSLKILTSFAKQCADTPTKFMDLLEANGQYSNYLLTRNWRQTELFRQGSSPWHRWRTIFPFRVILYKTSPCWVNFKNFYSTNPYNHRFVLVVREPRAVVASMLNPLNKEVSDDSLISSGRADAALISQIGANCQPVEYEGKTLKTWNDLAAIPAHIKGALVWRYMNQSLLELADQLGKDALIVPYNQLTNEPQAALEKILKHIGLKLHPNVLKHNQFYRDQTGHGGIRLHRPLDNASSMKWSSTLSPSEIDEIDEVVRDVVLQLRDRDLLPSI